MTIRVLVRDRTKDKDKKQEKQKEKRKKKLKGKLKMKEIWIMLMRYKKTAHKPEVWGGCQLQAKACQIGGEV